MFDFSYNFSPVSSPLNPEIQTFNSTPNQLEFSYHIREDAQFLFTNHQVYKRAIVPATVFVEMVLMAGKTAQPSKFLIVEDLVIQQALFINNNEHQAIHLSLNTSNKSVFLFEIWSQPKDSIELNTRTLHVSGRLRLLETPLTGKQNHLTSKIEHLTEVSVETYYKNCRERGIDYGSSFQVIRQLWQKETEALGQIQLSCDLSSNLSNYQVHPILLDSSLQILWAALPQTEKGKTYLPVGIECLKVYSSPPAKVWSYARLRNKENSTSRSLIADLCLFDQQGTILVELEGVLVEQVTDHTRLYDQPQQTIAITATFTAEPVEESIKFWMQELDLPYQSKFAPYNQVFQTLLNPNSLLAQNHKGVNVILIRLEDWDCPTTPLQLQVDADEQTKILANQSRYSLPNHLDIAHLNRYETEYLYQELFVDQVYLKHGIVLKDGDCVVDVGANIGLFTLFAQQNCPNGSIYSFEPAPHAFDQLQRNAALYCKNTILFNCGLSSENRLETFTFYPNSSVFSSFSADSEADEKAIRAVILNMLQQQSSLGEDDIEAFADEFLSGRLERETYQAQLRTLSSVIEEYNIERIDLLKLDAEKSELPVLQGIKDEHWPKIQQIVVEVHDQVGNIIAEVKTLLQLKGFELTIDEEDLLQSSGLYNIYATRRGKPKSALPEQTTIKASELERNVQDFCTALKAATQRASTPYIVGICPASPEVIANTQRQKLYQKIEACLAVELDNI
ncbi:MAG: FkbM family methyltransferase, partial [Cyanobacteriota bacterium]|nr:FkbM family methyltransferase [Cyanobacteriota bacterium]